MLSVVSYAQPGFIEKQKNFVRVANAFSKMEDTLKKQFDEKHINWPPTAMYIRSFKYDKQMEVWVQSKPDAPFTLFKTYKVCIQSGGLGPKRMEGDYQVPEGFYYINEFNPNSMFHLSLGLNYPNASDKILSNPQKPGSLIFIHGNCVSTGCIPIMDAPIEELYVLATFVRATALQEFIPVHVFPVRYNVQASNNFLQQAIQENPYLIQFNGALEKVFSYFNQHKSLPIVLVNREGKYIVN
jgi:murein L,D-transpeptidase YafK